jgi:integrase
MAKKRGQNEGSIRQRPDKMWEARVTIGVDANGKQIRKSLYGKTRKDVSEQMTDLLNNLQKGTITNPTEMTVSEWLGEYMRTYKKPYVRPATYNNYSVKVNNHIVPAIGHYKLKSLRQDIIQKFVNSLSEKGLSPSTVIDVYKLLHNALESAIDNGLIARNAADRVKLPKMIKPKINVLTMEQQDAFIAQAKTAYMGNMYIFDLCTGLRLGELLGLKWSDINFTNDELHVQRTIYKSKDPDDADAQWLLHFGAPKTESSNRTIPLNETAIQVLADVFEQQNQNKIQAGAAYEDNDLVFCTQLGRLLDPNNMRRTFTQICDKASISGLHPHCLRHTFATRGAENNIDVRVMQRFLGHATIQETADTYTHVLSDLKRSEILKLDKVMNY